MNKDKCKKRQEMIIQMKNMKNKMKKSRKKNEKNINTSESSYLSKM